MTTDARGTDERLAEILAELTDSRRKGEAPDLEAVARQHPELADDLRDLWAAAWIAEEVARTSDLSRDPEATAAWERPLRTRAAPGPGEPTRFGGCEILEELGRGGMGVVY